MDTQEGILVATAITAVAASLGAIATGVIAFFASRELRELSHSRHLDAAIQIHQEFGRLYRQRQFALNDLPGMLKANGDPDALSVDAQRQIATLATFFERVGALIDYGLVSKDLVFDLITWSAISCWASMKPVLIHWRNQRQVKLYENFELLASMCEAWLGQHKPKDIEGIIKKMAGGQVDRP